MPALDPEATIWLFYTCESLANQFLEALAFLVALEWICPVKALSAFLNVLMLCIHENRSFYDLKINKSKQSSYSRSI